MTDGHAYRGTIDDDLSVGPLTTFPATMMVADGIFSKRRQGVLQLQCGSANVSTIVDGVMVAQHRRQFPDRLAAIGGDIAHHAFITATIIADVDACDTMLPQDRQERALRSEEHTSELQSLMRISYAVFCLKKKKNKPTAEPYKIMITHS